MHPIEIKSYFVRKDIDVYLYSLLTLSDLCREYISIAKKVARRRNERNKGRTQKDLL